MEEKRIVCIGTGNPLTSPSSIHPENGRFYRYPPPGVVDSWGGAATQFIESKLPGHSLVAAYPGGPAIQGYGMIILGDTYTTELKTPLDSPDFIPLRKAEWQIRIEEALPRARAIAEDWARYGTLIIVGALPTSEELATARELRKRYAANRLNRAIIDHQAHRQSIYTDAERAWALEYGMLLPETVDSLARSQQGTVEDMPCPECKMLISSEARRCRYCATNFKMPLMDFVTKPEAAIAAK